jgi:hypothetical protein
VRPIDLAMSRREPAIYSSKNEDSDLRTEIDDFVIVLAEHVDELQDAEIQERYEDLIMMTEALADRSRDLGFASFAEAAHQVCVACQEQKPDTAREGLLELTDLARRIRLGHRGAA